MTTAVTQFNSYELDPLAAFGVGFDELPILISDGMGVDRAFGGEHICSIKSKAVPIETWRAHEFEANAYRHIFGDSAGEQGRISSSTGAVIRRNNKALKAGALRPHRMFLGYNAGEQS